LMMKNRKRDKKEKTMSMRFCDECEGYGCPICNQEGYDLCRNCDDAPAEWPDGLCNDCHYDVIAKENYKR